MNDKLVLRIKVAKGKRGLREWGILLRKRDKRIRETEEQKKQKKEIKNLRNLRDLRETKELRIDNEGEKGKEREAGLRLKE